MTYNFDPERWLENQLALLERRHGMGELNDDELARARQELDRRYDQMVERLDGTFRIPNPPPPKP